MVITSCVDRHGWVCQLRIHKEFSAGHSRDPREVCIKVVIQSRRGITKRFLPVFSEWWQ